MLLPNLEQAAIAHEKISAYVLNPAHPEGRHKARVLLAALGITIADAAWLANAILAELQRSDAHLQEHTAWGSIYRVDMRIVRGRRCARLRTVWLCTADAARLVTCFAIGECDETT